MQIRAAIFTVEVAAAHVKRAKDTEAVVLAELPALDAHSVHRARVAADEASVRRAAQQWVGRCELLFVLGGTDVGPGNETPAALASVVDALLPGFGEALRAVRPDLAPHPLLRRDGAGFAGRTLILWFPLEPLLVRAYLRELAEGIRIALARCAVGDQPDGQCS
jgi:molybdopterin biosynthesis enzyme MoaB